MAGRPPACPGTASNNFSQGWTTTAARNQPWKRCQSATTLRPGKSGLDSGRTNSPCQHGYHSPLGSDRLRGVGAEVAGTPPRKSSSEPSDREFSSDKEPDHDVHNECRARMDTLSTELAEANQALKALQRDQERLLRQMGSERQEFRLLQKTHGDSQQELSTRGTELKQCRHEISCLLMEQQVSAAKLRPWEEMEEQTAADLRSAVQASEAREHGLQSALNSETMSGHELAEKLRSALRDHQNSERGAADARAATKEKECRFSELQDQVRMLSRKSTGTEEQLGVRCAEFNALQAAHAESSAYQDVLSREVDQYKDGVAEEVSAELAEMRVSQDESVERRISEIVAERDEARRQAALMRNENLAAKKASEKRFSTADSESRAAHEKDLQELHTRSTKIATKKEAEVKMLQEIVDQSKTEIAELYDALVRSSENTKGRSNTKQKTMAGAMVGAMSKK